MQKNQHPLYSSCKQSKYCQWKVDSAQPHWVNWESTSAYDTDVDAAAEDLTGRLQMRVTELCRPLEAAQLQEALIAEVVTQVVEPVVAMMPTPVDMDMSGAGPGTTMGPGMPAQSEEMLLVLKADERIKQRKEEWKQK